MSLAVCGQRLIQLIPCCRHQSITVVWPGLVMVITPAQVHMQVDALFSAGIPPIITVGDPGVQGVRVTARQGIRVSTPKDPVVAAGTVGFARHLRMAKGMILTMGTWSMM